MQAASSPSSPRTAARCSPCRAAARAAGDGLHAPPTSSAGRAQTSISATPSSRSSASTISVEREVTPLDEHVRFAVDEARGAPAEEPLGLERTSTVWDRRIPQEERDAHLPLRAAGPTALARAGHRARLAARRHGSGWSAARLCHRHHRAPLERSGGGGDPLDPESFRGVGLLRVRAASSTTSSSPSATSSSLRSFLGWRGTCNEVRLSLEGPRARRRGQVGDPRSLEPGRRKTCLVVQTWEDQMKHPRAGAAVRAAGDVDRHGLRGHRRRRLDPGLALHGGHREDPRHRHPAVDGRDLRSVIVQTFLLYGGTLGLPRHLASACCLGITVARNLNDIIRWLERRSWTASSSRRTSTSSGVCRPTSTRR